MGAVVQHATVPGESETRDEVVGAVVQHATVPSESEIFKQCKSTETVFVLVTPTRLEPLLGLVFCPGCSGLLHPPGHS